MSQVTNAGDRPLLSRTSDSWAGVAIKDVLALLNDHAYLERKAASNALELLNGGPSRIARTIGSALWRPLPAMRLRTGARWFGS